MQVVHEEAAQSYAQVHVFSSHTVQDMEAVVEFVQDRLERRS